MRPYTRDKSTEYPERIQRLASEADGDLHEIGCAATNENDPDACNCVLRWWLERAAVPAAEAVPDAGLDVERRLRTVLAAWLAACEAEAGRGHGGPHDAQIRSGEPSLIPADDCAGCGGARYGTEDTLRTAMIEVAQTVGIPDDAPEWFRLAAAPGVAAGE